MVNKESDDIEIYIGTFVNVYIKHLFSGKQLQCNGFPCVIIIERKQIHVQG